MIVDGARALVSSVNGTENSVMNNREVAVIVESPDAAQYFQGAFDFDWGVTPRFSKPVGSCPGHSFRDLFIPGANVFNTISL
jgi:phosphatidylserine/phosphatidylglycerophosphate/cardiolipin synthase-like enzyme